MVNVIVALALTLLVTVASRSLLGHDPGGLVIIGLYLGFLLAVARLRSRGAAETASDDAPPDRSHWPLSGPFRKLPPSIGPALFMGVFWMTNLLSILNPFQLAQIVRQLVGNARLKAREEEPGGAGADYRTRAAYCLPFRGEWLVYNGGDTPATSHSWDILGQRYALDFVQVDGGLSRHGGRGTRLDDYHCYGSDILAAAGGTVMHLEDRIPDAPFVGHGFCDFTARSFLGNYVMIQHADDEHALYAHLIRGSVRVRPGEQVAQGQVIGRCGHSGHSSEPHLHFQLQDSPDIFRGMGLPVRFSLAGIDGTATSNRTIKAGQIVENICPQQAELGARFAARAPPPE